MYNRTKNSFRPSLEALEDRCLPSTTPLTMLAQPMWNAKAAEAVLGRIIQDVQQQLNALHAMHGDLLHASNQTATAMNAGLSDNQLLAKAAEVHLESKAVNPAGHSAVRLGAVLYNPDYLRDKYTAVASFRWQSADPKHYNPHMAWTTTSKIKFELEPSSKPGYQQSKIFVEDRSIFPVVPGTRLLEIRVDFYHQGKLAESAANGANIKIDYSAPLALNQTVTEGNTAVGGTSGTSMTQTENLTALAEMSARDRFFVGLAQQNHADGLPIVTAENWGV